MITEPTAEPSSAPERAGLSFVELGAVLIVVVGLAVWFTPRLIEDGRLANEEAAAAIVEAVGSGDSTGGSSVANELVTLDEVTGIVHRCGYDLWIDGGEPREGDVARTVVATPQVPGRSGRYQYRMTRSGELQRRAAEAGPTAAWERLD